MVNEKEVSCIFYHYIHYRLYERYGNKEVTVKEAKHFLFEWRILKSIRPIIIKELELLNLIERVDKKKIKFKKPSLNIEDLGKYYGKLGMY